MNCYDVIRHCISALQLDTLFDVRTWHLVPSFDHFCVRVWPSSIAMWQTSWESLIFQMLTNLTQADQYSWNSWEYGNTSTMECLWHKFIHVLVTCCDPTEWIHGNLEVANSCHMLKPCFHWRCGQEVVIVIRRVTIWHGPQRAWNTKCSS